jgi:N-succinyldiaminopimelate aminotransferase
MEAVSGLQTFATYCAPRLSQKLIAQALLSDETAAWLDRSRALYAEAAALTAATLSIATPESGTFVIFDTRPFLRNGESASDLLNRCAKRGVVLTPGAATGAAYADYARLCFTAIDGERLARALTILKGELSP